MKRLKKSVCMLLALALCVGTFTSLAAAAGMPSGKEEILAFYADAVNRVHNGDAGFAEKNSVGIASAGLTGYDFLDRQMARLLTEALNAGDASPNVFARGSYAATAAMPVCELKNTARISDAVITADGDNRKLKMTLEDDTLRGINSSGESYLSKITDLVHNKDVADMIFTETDYFKDVDYDVAFRNMTITATLTPEGRLLALSHSCSMEVLIRSVNVWNTTLKDLSVTVSLAEAYSDFDYESPPEYLLCDVSGDWNVTAEDARLALRLAVGLEDFAPGSRPYLAADTDENGVVDAADARFILRYAVGLEDGDDDLRLELTGEESLRLYTEGFNRIETEAKAVTRTEKTQDCDFVLVAGQLVPDFLTQRLTGALQKEDNAPAAVLARELPPAGIRPLDLRMEQLGLALCYGYGNTRYIMLNAETDPAHPQMDLQPGEGSFGALGPVLDPAEIAAALSAFRYEGMHIVYNDLHIAAEADKDSGRIHSLEYDLRCTLTFDKVYFGLLPVEQVEIDLSLCELYEIEY